MGDDENQSLADRMKSKGIDSEEALADTKRDTQESASLQKRLNMSGEESDPSEVTRPSRAAFADKFQETLDRAQQEAETAKDDDDDEPKSLRDKKTD